MQVGHIVHAWQAGDGAVLTVQIGQCGAVSQTCNLSQFIVVVTPQVGQRRAAFHIERVQITTGAGECSQLFVAQDAQLGQFALAVDGERGQLVVLCKQGLQVGHVADGADVGDGAVLTVQIGQIGTVLQTRNLGQVIVVVTLEIYQCRAVIDSKIRQVVAPAVETCQVRIVHDPE